MVKLKQHTNIALGYFLLVGLLGILLRLFFVTPIAANFRYVVHAHSHIALLGWVYIGIVTLIYKMYYTEVGHFKTYLRIFWFTNITILGMMLTFPFQGYAFLSITFSTLFLIASYFLAWFFLTKIPVHYKAKNSYRCIKASLIYLIISSIGPWAIGGVMATLGNTSIWYKLSIYFYLHFQYNAWFILALAGVFFYILEKAGILIPKKDFRRFFNLLNAGVVLSLFLSVLWVKPPALFYTLAVLGGFFQIIALYHFFKLTAPGWSTLHTQMSPVIRLLLKISATFLIVKVLLQLLTALPFFAELSYRYPDFVIGYLHLVFLGVISISLFAFLVYFGLLKLKKRIFYIYFTGFILSEILIFYKGAAMWLGLAFFSEYFLLLVSLSSLMPISIGLLLYYNLQSRRYISKSR
ncbi:hypothetical protein FK178_10480 [Antarcticibacterium arcticum]|uniref:Cytochrome C oxidase subunit I n=1 Tax=Antarcticibacterium arcticum TaxID=2585771 RepID=A0A5B8YJL4_9FLAO|nr:hypothetical protein [Antarcticibacterium arcticum]QED38122.1 hypothetical protein FK178_10480 [Antarcticibacterium arcticum]